MGLTIQQFNDIYNKEITKRYYKHELKLLSAREDIRKRKDKFDLIKKSILVEF